MLVEQIFDKRSVKPRNFGLDLTLEPTRYEEHVLQVLSDTDSPTVVKLLFGGKCGYGSPSKDKVSTDHTRHYRSNSSRACPSVDINGPRADVEQPSPVHVAVFPDVERLDKSFSGFLQHYMVPSAFRPAVYTVQSKKCRGGNGRLSGKIEVFPRIEVTGKFEVGYQGTDQQELPFVFGGSIQCKADGHEWKIGGESGPAGKDKTADQFLKSCRAGMSALMKKLGEMNRAQRRKAAGKVKFDLKWPKASLSAKASNQEVEGQYNVDVESAITLALDPLIGAGIDIDLLGLLLTTSGFGIVLERIRKEIEDGVNKKYVSAKGQLIIDLTVEGEIGGDFTYTKAVAKKWTKDGKVDGKVGFKLRAGITAEAAAKAKYIEIKFGAGALIELKGAERESDLCQISGELKPALDEQGKIGVEGAIKFNGMAIYYVAYIVVAVNKIPSKKGSKNDRESRKMGNKDKEPLLEDKHKYEGVEVLIEPWEWPPQPKKDDKAKAVAAGPEKKHMTPLKELLT